MVLMLGDPSYALGKQRAIPVNWSEEFQVTCLTPGGVFLSPALLLFKFRNIVKAFQKHVHPLFLENKVSPLFE